MPPKSPPPRSLMSSNQNITEMQGLRVASPDAMADNPDVKFEDYKLPPAVEMAMGTWTKNANNMATIMTLFATVQIILIQILPLSDQVSTPIWNATRFFTYAGILLHIGGAISAVAVVQMASTLPIMGRQLAMTNESSLPARIFNKNKTIPISLLIERAEPDLLEKWGLKWRWKFVAFHMMACYLLGFMFAILSLTLWIYSWEASWAAIGGAILPMLLLSAWSFWTVLGS